jgi:hypothetical protein
VVEVKPLILGLGLKHEILTIQTSEGQSEGTKSPGNGSFRGENLERKAQSSLGFEFESFLDHRPPKNVPFESRYNSQSNPEGDRYTIKV